jgi:putative transposase
MLRSEPAGVPLHLIRRGHGRGACFFCARDRLVFLHWLGACAKRFECALHAYVLMGNHVHLLVTPACAGGATDLIQATCSRYERECAGNGGHAGPLWEVRFEATPVYAPRYVLACMCYIELNPVRATLEQSPGDYRWSSYRANALGEYDALVTPHAFYYALGRSPAARQAAYRALFRGRVAPRRMRSFR